MRNTLAASSQITSHLSALWNARQTIRHNFAANHQDSFVALANGGQEFLNHHGLRAFTVQRLNDGAQIEGIIFDTKNAHAAHTVQGLQNNVAVHRMESANRLRVAGHQGRADELRKLQYGEFFWVITQCTGLVKNFRAFALCLF